MNNQLRIAVVNACGNKEAQRKLHYEGDQNLRICLLIQELLKQEAYDAISITEIPYNALKQLRKYMGGLYSLFPPRLYGNQGKMEI